MTIQDQLRQRFAEFSPAFQQVARYLLEHPADVVTQSMRHIGVQAGSTPATLVRFAQSLGFTGWPQLKAGFVADMGLASDAYGARAQQLIGRAAKGDLVADMFAVQRHNLEATHAQSAAGLASACAVIEQAPVVHVAGFRASYPLAFALVYQYRLFRPTVQLLDGPGGTLEMQLRAMGKGDALVVVAFAPYSREALQAAEAGRAAGCHIVALTDSPASPLALLAHERLVFGIASPSFFPSIAAGLALTEALVAQLASRAGKGVVKRIDLAERQLFESGAYREAPQPRGG